MSFFILVCRERAGQYVISDCVLTATANALPGNYFLSFDFQMTPPVRARQPGGNAN